MASPSLKKAQIRYKNKAKGELHCKLCGAEWVDGRNDPNRGGRRRRGWWQCPVGCNIDLLSEPFPPPGEMEGGG